MTVFLKGHGTGNDFVLLPDPEARLELTAAQVRLLCDRRFGIGADGILRVVPTALVPEVAHLAAAPWFMDYRNSDGSLSSMCGNGIRVFARYLVSSGLAPAGRLRIATRGGIREVDADATGDITVDLGEWTPAPDATVTVNGVRREAIGIAIPNPHLVAHVDDLAGVGSLQHEPQSDPAFADGTNFEFMLVRAPFHLGMRVYERGSGETLSCGTGAAAVAVAASQFAGVQTGTYRVDVPGGTLQVRIDGQRVWLTGPAEIVAEGTLRPGWDAPLLGDHE